MTLIHVLMAAGIAGDELLAFLRRVGDALPDLKPTADDFSARLHAVLSEESIAKLGETLKVELGDILRGRIDPREHPSDGI